MAGKRKTSDRANDGSHPTFPEFPSVGRTEVIDLVSAVGSRVAFYSVVAAGAYYAMAHGANVIWCAGFGAYITALFELSDWLRHKWAIGHSED
jgi:hypothetical protein